MFQVSLLVFVKVPKRKNSIMKALRVLMPRWSTEVIRHSTMIVAKKDTVEPLYSDHPWGTTFWPLNRGALLRGYVHKLFIWDLAIIP